MSVFGEITWVFAWKVPFGHFLLLWDSKGLANLIGKFNADYRGLDRKWTNNIEVFFSLSVVSCDPIGGITSCFDFIFLVGFGQQSASDNSCRMDNLVAFVYEVMFWCRKPVACFKLFIEIELRFFRDYKVLISDFSCFYFYVSCWMLCWGFAEIILGHVVFQLFYDVSMKYSKVLALHESPSFMCDIVAHLWSKPSIKWGHKSVSCYMFGIQMINLMSQFLIVKLMVNKEILKWSR